MNEKQNKVSSEAYSSFRWLVGISKLLQSLAMDDISPATLQRDGKGVLNLLWDINEGHGDAQNVTERRVINRVVYYHRCCEAG